MMLMEESAESSNRGEMKSTPLITDYHTLSSCVSKKGEPFLLSSPAQSQTEGGLHGTSPILPHLQRHMYIIDSPVVVRSKLDRQVQIGPWMHYSHMSAEVVEPWKSRFVVVTFQNRAFERSLSSVSPYMAF
jgi:hypothetical protein